MVFHLRCLRPTGIAGACLALLQLLCTTQAGHGAESTELAGAVQSIFERRCVACHDPDAASGGLNLASQRGALAGGSSGAVVVAGNPDGSRLYQLVSHQASPKMPPDSPRIPDDELQVLRQWIESLASGEANPAIGSGATRDVGIPAAVEMPHPVGQLDPPRAPRRPNAITALAASADGRLVAVSGPREVLLFDQKSMTFRYALPFPEGTVYVLRFSPRSDLLIAGGGENARSGRVVAWSMRTGERLLEVGDEADVALAADISPDQTVIALGGPKRKLKFYSTRDGALLRTVEQHGDWITSLAFSPDGVLLASADRAGKLFLWESLSGFEYGALPGHASAINQVCWRQDANVLATVGEDGQAILWDVERVKQLAAWSAHSGGARGVSFAAGGQVVVTCGRDHTVKSWSPTGQPIKTVFTGSTAQLQLAVASDELQVFTGDLVGWVRGVRYATGNVEAESPALKPEWDQWPARLSSGVTIHSSAAENRPDEEQQTTASTQGGEGPNADVSQEFLSAMLPPALPPLPPSEAIVPLPPSSEPPPPAVAKAERRRLRAKYVSAGFGAGTGTGLLWAGGALLLARRRSKQRPMPGSTFRPRPGIRIDEAEPTPLPHNAVATAEPESRSGTNAL